jgi:hypothetical protein
MAEIVDPTALWKTVVVAVIAGVGITALFAFTLYFAVHAQEAQRNWT